MAKLCVAKEWFSIRQEGDQKVYSCNYFVININYSKKGILGSVRVSGGRLCGICKQKHDITNFVEIMNTGKGEGREGMQLWIVNILMNY